MKSLLIAILLVTSACGTTRTWHKPEGATERDFLKTRVECEVKHGQAGGDKGHNMWWPLVDDAPSVYELCMRSNGYEVVK